jgi:cell division protein FtsB
MSRYSDSKEAERLAYNQDHSTKRSFDGELKALQKKNKKLEAQVAELKEKLKRYKDE